MPGEQVGSELIHHGQQVAERAGIRRLKPVASFTQERLPEQGRRRYLARGARFQELLRQRQHNRVELDPQHVGQNQLARAECAFHFFVVG